MGLILPAIIGASAAFAQQPTMDKLQFASGSKGYTAMSANKQISGAVVIPDTYNGKPVTGVATFTSIPTITSAVFPNSLTEIGGNTFLGCTGIKSITIPASVTKIGMGAFGGCTNLTSVTFQGGNASVYLNNANYNLSASSFPGDLSAKYQAGGAGTYTRSAGSNTWTKQGAAVCPTCGRPL